MLKGDRPFPAKRCSMVEEATAGEVTRYDLRPDIFGPAPSAEADMAPMFLEIARQAGVMAKPKR